MKTKPFYDSLIFGVLAILVLSIALTIYHFQANTIEVKSEEVVQAFCGNLKQDSLAKSIEVGKKLFRNNCAACHNKNMRDDLTAPALGGVQERWSAYPQKDLYRWIRNAQMMIRDKHPKALELWKQWRPTIMTPAENLTDDDIEALLDYINYTYKP